MQASLSIMQVTTLGEHILLAIGLCFFLVGCERSIENQIVASIEERCDNFEDECLLTLSQITSFEWDKMYVFGEVVFPEDISRVIGFQCDCGIVPDSHTRLLFTKDSTVIHYEDYASVSNKTLQFRRADSSRGMALNYTPENAIFHVLRKRSSAGLIFYDLYPQDGYLQPQ